ncbi:hypothetical protein SAMN04488096_11062 [Mesonia phycicola]|uniref:Uncharacterized protein n=1 Tax=Mesonia phycicola TaxID=579105 RepID=A0A1M6HCW5_9FLAO|nr:hypothetical protein [Mesonia phycicola]SHJ19929.1 hypothetical protein SAMN04488096_11062 [Mesonia phycicola]
MIRRLIKSSKHHSSEEKNNENIFFVINVFGANLYEKPTLDSKVIKNIKIGESILANKTLKISQTIYIGTRFQLTGNFVQVKNQIYSGFIHSSDLTRFKPKLEPIYEDISIPDFKGKIIQKTTNKRIEVFNNHEYEIEEEITTYENVIHTYTNFGDCFEHTCLYKYMTLPEVYHQLPVHNPKIDVTPKGNFILMPEFIKKTDNKYDFKGRGITRSISIIKNKDQQYLISSLDCP